MTYGSTTGGIQQEAYANGKLWISTGHAFITGYINAVFFVRYKGFATTMTGNMMMCAFSLGHVILARCGKTSADPDSSWIQTFPPPYMYAAIIAMFLVGGLIYRLLASKRQWTVSTFGPLVVLWFVAHELIDFIIYGKEVHNTWNMMFLAPVCGIIDSLALKGRIGNLPHCTTANLLHLVHTLVDDMTDGGNPQARKTCLIEACMFTSVILGATVGFIIDAVTPVSWDFELSVISPLLAMLYYMQDQVKPLLPA
mmetsp:Transcript_115609/g.338172  ORF Transcript_115609/g.338172 Transcript_115609/m.338172 type:complete len:254 (-) Transcript_115609:49-810(-)